MRQSGVFITLAVLAGGSVALADGLPRSFSFENQTSSRVNMTVTEDSSNEKEIEFGDVDNDGDLDVVVGVGSSDFGGRKNKLYINNGGVLDEVSSTFIAEFNQVDVSRNAFLRDFDGDGWLDIYIINDSNTGGFGGSDHLYIAQHEGDVLTGYSEEGLSRIASGGALGAACGGVAVDLDQDGDMDVYSGNYPGPSQDVGLYNNGAGVLSNLTSTLVPADSDYTVDVAAADMNGNGKLDLLISNWGGNRLYYNDNGAGSSGVGDFRYTGSSQNLGSAGANENAMEPADFDNDGDNDIYWANKSGSTGDRILENTGNDAANRAILVERDVLPASATSIQTRKASVADFNDDGKIDVFVAAQTGARPTVLRNTSVAGGPISFVDWSPNLAFPNTATLRGWHGGVADTNGDGDVDILIGGFNGDHLIENTRANEVNESDIGPSLPSLWNLTPVALRGTADDGETDEYSLSDVGSGFLSIVLNGPADYRLTVVDASENVLGESDRGGIGVEEALQVSTSVGVLRVRVTVLEGGAACGGPDLNGDCMVDFGDLLELLSNWGCVDCPQDLDGNGAGFSDLLLILSNWGPVPSDNMYQLEVLGRS